MAGQSGGAGRGPIAPAGSWPNRRTRGTRRGRPAAPNRNRDRRFRNVPGRRAGRRAGVPGNARPGGAPATTGRPCNASGRAGPPGRSARSDPGRPARRPGANAHVPGARRSRSSHRRDRWHDRRGCGGPSGGRAPRRSGGCAPGPARRWRPTIHPAPADARPRRASWWESTTRCRASRPTLDGSSVGRRGAACHVVAKEMPSRGEPGGSLYSTEPGLRG